MKGKEMVVVVWNVGVGKRGEGVIVKVYIAL